MKFILNRGYNKLTTGNGENTIVRVSRVKGFLRYHKIYSVFVDTPAYCALCLREYVSFLGITWGPTKYDAKVIHKDILAPDYNSSCGKFASNEVKEWGYEGTLDLLSM